jgi:hypothetical protein
MLPIYVMQNGRPEYRGLPFNTFLLLLAAFVAYGRFFIISG